VLQRLICCGPFTTITENFLISSYFLNRPAGCPRMRLTDLAAALKNSFFTTLAARVGDYSETGVT
jgi:hypothetical protein